MNEQEEKPMFMAMYLGQVCYLDKFHKEPQCLYSMHVDSVMEDEHLLLRTVDMLTDEEVLKLGKLLSGHTHETYTERQIMEVGYRFIHHIRTGTKYVWGVDEVQQGADYLRSIGVLLPWREYSTADILAKGWARVKEVSNG